MPVTHHSLSKHKPQFYSQELPQRVIYFYIYKGHKTFPSYQKKKNQFSFTHIYCLKQKFSLFTLWVLFSPV